MKISKIREVKNPVRANETDAGIDFFVPKEFDAIDLWLSGRNPHSFN